VVRGSWFVVRGSWFVVRGSWFVVRGSWFVVRGSWFVKTTDCTDAKFPSYPSRSAALFMTFFTRATSHEPL